MKLLFVVFLVLLNSIATHQQKSCILPDGQMSICVRQHYCAHFQDILRQYRGNPPADVIANIRLHQCDGGLCCPDNATDIPSPRKEQKHNFIDFNAIKNHRNINLINEKTCGVVSSNRIVHGVNAEIREFPWAALLGYQSGNNLVFQCGGTLISQRFVLTATHCINKELVSVRLGEHTISKRVDCDDNDPDQCADPVQDIMIETKIKHPLFNRRTKENDLGLLKLARPADLTKNNVNTICLPISSQSDLEDFKKTKSSLTVTGWGITERGESSDILQKALVPYIELDKCNAIFTPENIGISYLQLCAGYTKDSKHIKTDSCKGDSGGGLTAIHLYNDKPKALLYGVVTGGVKCENKNLIYPGIYVNIRYFLTWILDNMSY